MIWFFVACMSVHKIGTLADFSSTAEQTRNANTLIDVALRETWSDSTTARTLALQNIGLMRSQSPEVIDGLMSLIQYHNPDIRRQATWALGEVSRDLEWNDATQGCLNALTAALLRSKSQMDAEYTLDAIIKLYTPHVHSVEEDLALLRKLQSYHAQTSEAPVNFYLLEREIQSIPVLLQLMGEQLNGSVDQLYTSDLALIRYLERNRGALSAPQYRRQIQEVLTKEFELLSVENQSIQMLSLWMLANSAHNDMLSEEVATRLIAIAPDLDSELQILLHMALWEMRNIEAVRRYLRTFLAENSDADIHRVIGMLGQKVDLIQELYNVSVSGSTR